MTAGVLVSTILIQILLILINAVFAATEMSVMQLSANKLRKMAEDGDKSAAGMIPMVEEPSNFLSAIQIAITLVNFLGGAFAAENFAGPLVNFCRNTFGWTNIPEASLRTIIVVFITLTLSYFTLVFGELVPKQIALFKAYPVAKVTTPLIRAISVIMKPVIWLISASTSAVLHLFGIKGKRGQEAVTEDEIRMMVDVGHESGTIDSEEKEMIDNVFELDKTIARDVMTHRIDVVSLEADAEVEEIVELIKSSGMSRLPVYDDSLDNILGILNVRTYLLDLRCKNPSTVRELLRPAYFVPETAPVDVLLRDMQQRKDHIVLALDEYGGFSGVVTMEDVIEQIVGNIYDEFDALDEPEIYKQEDNLWRIAGDCDIEDIEDELGVVLPDEREYDSLGGLVFSQLSLIPADGEKVEVEVYGMHIKTEPVIDHHVQWAMVSLLPPENPEKPIDETEEESKKKK